MNELTIFKEVKPVAEVFTEPVMDTIISRLEKEAEGFVGDPSTANGRAEIKSFAQKFVKTKTYIEDARKKYVAELKKLPSMVDAEGRKLRNKCDALRDKIRAPLTEWENIRKEVDESINHFTGLTLVHRENSECIAEEIEILLYTSSVDIVEDKRKEYNEALQRALDAQFGFLAEAINAENDAEELERLRLEKEAKEAEEQKQKEIDEARAAAKKEAEEAAEKAILQAKLDKANAEKAAREAKEAEEQAKKDKQAAIDRAEEDKQAALEAERQKSLAERNKSAALSLARQSDENNRNNIHNAIRQALMDDGLNWGQAQVALDAIVGGRVPHVVIKY